MEADRLYNDPCLAQFYDIENEWHDSLEYCKRLASHCSSLLDLGCGTGLFATAIAQNDSAWSLELIQHSQCLILQHVDQEQKSMLDTGGCKSLQLNQRFELIVLTGHAFQVFLNDIDQKAVLQMMAAIYCSWSVIFDSRNPKAENGRHGLQHSPNDLSNIRSMVMCLRGMMFSMILCIVL